MLRDLESSRLIVIKGALFLCLAALAAALLFLEAPTARTGVLLGALIWSACRFYYFLFYVLEKYVDPSLKYSGLRALIARLARQR
jgi:uncharacterized membrane protein